MRGEPSIRPPKKRRSALRLGTTALLISTAIHLGLTPAYGSFDSSLSEETVGPSSFEELTAQAEQKEAIATLATEEVSGGETMVIPMGNAVGIKLFSDGVVVVGLSQIETGNGTTTPAKDCGLQAGDIITHINSQEVDSIEDVMAVLTALEDSQMTIRAIRDDSEIQLTTQAVQCSTDGTYKLGAWVRDSMGGIGTMTYYDPATNTFGALGHGINDADTTQQMPLLTGSILPAEVTAVTPGTCGTPGSLHGAFDTSTDLGLLTANTDHGIFGQLDCESMIEGMVAIPVATADEITTGSATILSNIEGNDVVEYDVEITKLYSTSSDDPRDLLITVTDPDLLQITGGIVQGMSGSPILQNGKIIGAVTHVFINDPTQGYGISMETMMGGTAVS